MNYDRKHIMKRLFLTWRKSELEIVAERDFVVKDKSIIKLYKQTTGKCILELATKDGKHVGLVEVNAKEYKKAKIGGSFDKCTLLSHSGGSYVFVNAFPEHAINKVSRSSKVQLLMLSAIMFFSFLSFIFILKEASH